MEIKKSPVVVGGEKRAYASGTSAIGARGFVTLSGAVGEDADTGKIPDDIGEQTTIALTNITTRLEAQESSLENIMHIWWYLVGPFPEGISATDDWKKCARAIEAFWKDNYPEFHYKDNPPAGTLLGVTALAGPKLKIEIMIMAAIA